MASSSKQTTGPNSSLSPEVVSDKRTTWALLIGIIFVAAVLRAPMTSVGPLVGTIRDDLNLSNTMAGSLTTLPLLVFAFFSPFAPKLARRYGVEMVLLGAMGLLTLGILIRSSSGAGTLFLGTALLGLGIALGNVLMPGLIKREFPARIGLMTGIYTVSMNLCGAIASGISVPLVTTAGMGWKGSLGGWALLSLVSLLLWAPQVLKRRSRLAVAAISAVSEHKPVQMWRSSLAWKITLFMGLQSMFFYSFVAWLPEILTSRGLPPDQAGWMLSLMQLAQLPFTFLVPILAGRMANQRLLVTFTFVLFMAGFSGLELGSAQWIPLWVAMCGVAGGSAFSLAMMFFTLRTRTTQEASELSGMAQSFGYLLAAAAPTLFGYLHDVSGGWRIPILLLILVASLMFIVGWSAGSNRYIEPAGDK